MTSPDPRDLIQTLKTRFDQHVHRHQGVAREKVQARLEASSAALDARKQNKSTGCVEEVVVAMGVELLSEQHSRDLQVLGEFDTRTSSRVATPDNVRSRGGARFRDRRIND